MDVIRKLCDYHETSLGSGKSAAFEVIKENFAATQAASVLLL
jgi:hypothetical protein